MKNKLKKSVVCLLAVIMIVAVYLDMRRSQYSYYITDNVPAEEYFVDAPKLLEKLVPQSKEDAFRVTAVEAENWPYNLNMADITGFYDTLGYGNPIFAKSFSYRNSHGFDSKYYDMLNVKYFVAEEESRKRLIAYLPEDTVPAFEIYDMLQPPYHLFKRSHVYVFENFGRLGYAWLVDDFISYTDSEDPIAIMENRTEPVDLKKTAVVHETVFATLTDIIQDKSELSFKINVLQKNPNYLKLKVSTSKDAILVLSELFYPGWRVFLNEKPVEMFEVNHILRGNLVFKGDNVVEYRFSPLSFRIGFLLLIFGLLVGIFGAMFGLIKKK